MTLPNLCCTFHICSVISFSINLLVLLAFGRITTKLGIREKATVHFFYFTDTVDLDMYHAYLPLKAQNHRNALIFFKNQVKHLLLKFS